MKMLFLFLSILSIKNMTAQNVGIGTNTPVGTLNIYNADSSTVYFHNTVTGSTIADGFFIGNQGNATGYIWNKESASIKFGTSNIERLTILSSGNVGIGYTGPTYRLSVNGVIYSNGDYVNGTSEIVGNGIISGQLSVGGSAAFNNSMTVGGSIAVGGSITAGGKGIVRSDNANQMVIHEYTSPSNLNATLGAGGHLCCISMNFSATFLSKPSIAFGEITNTTNPGNIVFTIESITTTGAQIAISNVGNTTSTITNGSLKAMIIGRK